MYTHMKTTVDISNAVLREAKDVADRDDTTVRALIEEGLRRVLDERRRKPAFQLRPAAFKGKGLQPEVREGTWERIREMAYEGRGT